VTRFNDSRSKDLEPEARRSGGILFYRKKNLLNSFPPVEL